jgi:hypothetical protein
LVIILRHYPCSEATENEVREFFIFASPPVRAHLCGVPIFLPAYGQSGLETEVKGWANYLACKPINTGISSQCRVERLLTRLAEHLFFSSHKPVQRIEGLIDSARLSLKETLINSTFESECCFAPPLTRGGWEGFRVGR